MTDIAEFHIEWLVPYVRKSRDVSPLVEHLSSGGEVSDQLKPLLIDILLGHLKPSHRLKTAANAHGSGALRAEVDFWTGELRLHAHIPRPSQLGQAPVYSDWSVVEAILANAGYYHVPETVGDCKRAALKIVSWRNRLTISQLDEKIFPRLGRKINK